MLKRLSRHSNRNNIPLFSRVEQAHSLFFIFLEYVKNQLIITREEQNSGYDSTKKETGNTTENFDQQARQQANEFKEGWNQATHTQENKKVLAGILGIVLGGFGVHKFILCYTQEGIIQMVITIVTCGIGSIIGLIEGIIYLTKSDEEFYQTYQVGKKGWF